MADFMQRLFEQGGPDDGPRANDAPRAAEAANADAENLRTPFRSAVPEPVIGPPAPPPRQHHVVQGGVIDVGPVHPSHPNHPHRHYRD